MEEWNSNTEIVTELGQIKFNSNIAYGFKDQKEASGIIEVVKGKVVSAGEYQGQLVQWDLRAAEEDWREWFKKPPGMMTLGLAYTSRKLAFKKGDYASMLKDPRMAGPFIKSFSVMAHV